MKIYKNGQLFFESTDSATLQALIESLSNNLYNNHYTKSEVMSLIASARSVYQVATMPASPSPNVLYYVGSSSPYAVKLVDSNRTIVDLGSSEVDLTDYVKKSDIATSFSASSTNDKVAGALAAFNSFAPMNSVNAISYAITPANNALFNFQNQDTTSGYRQYEQKMYTIGQMNDPITNEVVYGPLRVEQSVVLAYQVRITQTITSDFHTSGAGMEGKTQKVFRRVGVLTSNSNTVLLNPYTNGASVVWGEWYPLEYPKTQVSVRTGVTGFTNFAVWYSVTGGMLNVCARHIQTSEAPNDTHVADLPTMPTKADGGNVAPLCLINDTSGACMQLYRQNSGIEMFVYNVQAGKRYLGELNLPLGY